MLTKCLVMISNHLDYVASIILRIAKKNHHSSQCRIKKVTPNWKMFKLNGIWKCQFPTFHCWRPSILYDFLVYLVLLIGLHDMLNSSQSPQKTHEHLLWKRMPGYIFEDYNEIVVKLVSIRKLKYFQVIGKV